MPFVSLKKIQKKRELQPLNNLKKIFFRISSLRGNLKQANIRKTSGLIET
jgi:hypothetical protein